MAKTSAGMMREYVRSQNFTSTDEIMAAMKDMFGIPLGIKNHPKC